jgi:4-aminobutyrate aminotransferase-like enzyme
MAPPLSISEEEIDTALTILDEAIAGVLADRPQLARA